MLNVGIIGAGTISRNHIAAYKKNRNVKIVAIADINEQAAKALAEEHGIDYYCTDYHDILNDKNIDAVSIATPTFLHKQMVIEAIQSDKHILCEKPPALNAQETQECIDAHKGSDKCFMYGLVCRFRNEMQYLKQYIESGKMGKVICANVTRTSRMSTAPGWFGKKALGGGLLRDIGIHEIDSPLYLMGFPKIKSVLASVSYENARLPEAIQTNAGLNIKSPVDAPVPDTESVVNAIITTEDGASITIKLSRVLLTVKTGYSIEIHGEKAGAEMQPIAPDKRISMVELTDDMYIREFSPTLTYGNHFPDEINHFVDCCLNGTPCICPPEHGLVDMQIIDAIYKSAETGEPVIF